MGSLDFRIAMSVAIAGRPTLLDLVVIAALIADDEPGLFALLRSTSSEAEPQVSRTVEEA